MLFYLPYAEMLKNKIFQAKYINKTTAVFKTKQLGQITCTLVLKALIPICGYNGHRENFGLPT